MTQRVGSLSQTIKCIYTEDNLFERLAVCIPSKGCRVAGKAHFESFSLPRAGAQNLWNACLSTFSHVEGKHTCRTGDVSFNSEGGLMFIISLSAQKPV